MRDSSNYAPRYRCLPGVMLAADNSPALPGSLPAVNKTCFATNPFDFLAYRSSSRRLRAGSNRALTADYSTVRKIGCVRGFYTMPKRTVNQKMC